MEWRFKSPEISMSEFYGGGKNEPFTQFLDEQPKDNEEVAVKKAAKNIDKFIPKYLEWYVSQFTRWE